MFTFFVDFPYTFLLGLASQFLVAIYNLLETEMFSTKTFLKGFVQDDQEGSYAIKKMRKSYTYQEKADIIHKYLEAKSQDESLTFQKFADSQNIAKTVLLRWVKDRDNVIRKCSELYQMCSFT